MKRKGHAALGSLLIPYLHLWFLIYTNLNDKKLLTNRPSTYGDDFKLLNVALVEKSSEHEIATSFTSQNAIFIRSKENFFNVELLILPIEQLRLIQQ